MSEHDLALRRFLETCEDPAHQQLRQFVLARGMVFTPQPYPHDGPQRQPLGECFRASIVASNNARLAYVEGFALDPTGRPHHHAWCADELDRVIDCTWGDRGLAYFGVRLPEQFVDTRWQELRGTVNARHFNLLPSFIVSEVANRTLPPIG